MTQVRSGISDFRHQFGRLPEGRWLPETAVDAETLEVLAEHGLKFTILAPRQASRIRSFRSRSWKDVSGDKIDPSRAYLVRLPSRRTISVFFYDSPISQAVAFEGLLNDGQRFDSAEMIRLLDESFGKKVYSLRSIFRDEQRKILKLILNDKLTDTEAAYRALYEPNAQLIHFLNDLHVPIPKALRSAAEIALQPDTTSFSNYGTEYRRNPRAAQRNVEHSRGTRQSDTRILNPEKARGGRSGDRFASHRARGSAETHSPTGTLRLAAFLCTTLGDPKHRLYTFDQSAPGMAV